MHRAALALSLLFLATAPATAAALTVGGGATIVALEPSTAKSLKALGITVAPTGDAEAERRGLAFPVTGGKLVGLSGSVRHAGGLKLTDGRRSITLSRLRVVFEDHPFVQARVGGGDKLKVFTLDVDDAEITDDVSGSAISGLEVDLARQGARALNAAFRTKAFETGTKVGDAVVLATARAVRFTGGQTDLAIDKGAADALTSLGVSAAPAEGAVANDDGSFGFPITGGRLTENSGTIFHAGGVVLSKGDASVTLTDLVLDDKHSQLRARVNGGAPVVILNLDRDDADASATDDSVTIEDIQARLTKKAADALNEAFGTNRFQAGLTFGELTVRGEATS